MSGNQRTLGGMIHYLTDELKCAGDIISFNVSTNPDIALKEMAVLKKLHGKEEGRLYKQFMFSFDSEIDGLRREQIKEIGYRIGQYYADNYQIIGAVHFDTNNIHIQYMLNTVNARNGKKFSQSPQDVREYKKYINTILSDYGLNPIYYYEKSNDDN